MDDEVVWTRVDGARTTIGIRPAVVAVNRVTFLELLGTGKKIRRNGAIGLVQFERGREIEITSPIAGTIVEINEAVNCVDDPAIVNDDPEGAGWLVVLAT